MQIEQHQSSSYRWQTNSNYSPRDSQQIEQSTTMSNRNNQPLIFSIDDRLAQEHLTRLDLTSKYLKKIERLPTNINYNIVLLDHNEITRIEQLDIYPQLIQLSISYNRLMDIYLLSRLRSLQKLNLSHNIIDSVDYLRTLQNLVMLNISHNNIASIAALNACHALQSLDASENALQQIEDLSNLKSLKYLNLHKNFLHTLISIPRYLPKSLHTLILSNNDIQDLTEISYLSSLVNLNTFYIADNPCLSVNDQRYGCQRRFDYRPYVLNWCLSIQNLDEIFITRKESLKAEWLLSQGKGRSFGAGEHEELVQYLTRVCGIDADERDDLHLSQIMQKQNLHHRQNPTTNDFDYHRMDIISPRSVNDETIGRSQQYHARTPSPANIRPNSVTSTYTNEQQTEILSTPRYADYDNRPIKPLDQNMLQTKLNQYPVDSSPTETLDTTRSESKKTYNANRYSPKTTSRGPTASSICYTRSTRNPARQRHTRVKRQTATTHALRALHQFNETGTHPLATAIRTKKDEQHLSAENDEVEYQSLPNDPLVSTMNNSIEIHNLTASMETMRTSVLQAYLDLRERFNKTNELQTSAIAALWKQVETQNVTHQRETERILEENRLLNQRIHELELRLNAKSNSSSLKQNPNLHPPLRAHISKRDAKSFFLHWIPNPLNEHQTILGYRIYIDEILKGSIDSGRFETAIDHIRDEGEYKIKLRTYDQHGESTDSNTVIARFRRQRTTTSNSESGMSIQPVQFDEPNRNAAMSAQEQAQIPIIMDRRHSDADRTVQMNNLQTPEKQTSTSNEHIASQQINLCPASNENIISLKPPKSPNSSPSRAGKTSPKTNNSCSKTLFANTNTNESSSIPSTKRSPTRTGIMSRLAKHSQNTKRNNLVLNTLPTEATNSPPEIPPIHIKAVKRTITFQPDAHSRDHGHILAQKVPIKPSDMLNSMDIQSLLTNSETLSSISLSSRPTKIK